MTTMTTSDLNDRILRAVASCRVQADIPAAVLAEINFTHSIIENALAMRVHDALMAANKTITAKVFYEAIRHDAAESDTPETST